MIHHKFETMLRFYLAKQYKCQAEDIQIETLSTDNIKGQIGRPDQETVIFDLDYQTVAMDILTWFLNQEGVSEAEGFHSVVSVHHDDIASHMGFWIASKISDDDMPFIARKMHTDAMSEDFQYAIEYLIEDRYAEWYNAPQAELERAVRAKLEMYDFYSLDTIPVETWLNLLNDPSASDAEAVVMKILDYLAAHNGNLDEISAIRKGIELEHYQTAVKNLCKESGQGIKFYSRQITEAFEANKSTEDAAEQIKLYMEQESKHHLEILRLKEAFARAGKNILLLQSYPLEQQRKHVRDAVVAGISAETCFENLIAAASAHSPHLVNLDTNQIVYVTESAHFDDLRSGKYMLNALNAYQRDQIPSFGDATLYILNHKAELVDILVDVNQRFSAAEGQLGDLNLVLEQRWLGKTLDDMAEEKETILSIDDWIKQYQIRMDEDGEFLDIDFDDHETINNLADMIWTEYDSGIIENRLGFVNRLRYLVGEVAHPKFEEKAISVIRTEPSWDNIHHDELELQITYAARQLVRKKSALIESIRLGLEEGFNFILEELEVAEGDDLSHWTDRLQKLYDARAALKRLH